MIPLRQEMPVRLDASSLLDLLDTAIVHLDGEHRVQWMNTAGELCFGCGRDRALGRFLQDIEFIPAEIHDAMQSIRGSDGSLRMHELPFPGGKYDCILQVDTEGMMILELHNLEWEHKRLRLEQRELQIGMLELLSRNLGHEIRNPLGGIRGASQMLANELSSPEMANLARLIMREADRIDELILSFGQPQLAENVVDLYPLLDEVLELARAEFGGTTSVERDFDPSIPSFQGDAPAIRRVLLNLVRNAFQAGAQQLVIRTRIEHGGALLLANSSSLLRIDIIDDGEGVPESLRNLLFLPLVTGKRNGTGLGLALSQQIAAAHGGLLTYEPLNQASEGGSCFSLYLPLGRVNATNEPGGGR